MKINKYKGNKIIAFFRLDIGITCWLLLSLVLAGLGVSGFDGCASIRNIPQDWNSNHDVEVPFILFTRYVYV